MSEHGKSGGLSDVAKGLGASPSAAAAAQIVGAGGGLDTRGMGASPSASVAASVVGGSSGASSSPSGAAAVAAPKPKWPEPPMRRPRAAAAPSRSEPSTRGAPSPDGAPRIVGEFIFGRGLQGQALRNLIVDSVPSLGPSLGDLTQITYVGPPQQSDASFHRFSRRRLRR